MTSPGHSPPRSKKGSSAENSDMTAGSVVAELFKDVSIDALVEPAVDVDEPGESKQQSTAEVDNAANSDDADEMADDEAKETARRQREEAKATLRRQRDEAKARAREAKEAAAHERAEAKEAARRERAEAKEAAARERDEAKEAARREREEAKAGAAAAKAARRKDHDGIVEAPRAPKVPFRERRRRRSADKAQARRSAAPTGGKGRRTAIAVLAALLGAVGLICSVILALGALLVALGSDEGNSTYDLVSGICDTLVGPLRDVFTFSGANGDMKEALAAWGLGSMGYLVVGLFLQSFLRSRIDD